MDPTLKALLERKQKLDAEAKALLKKPKAERTPEEQARLHALIGTPAAEGGYTGGELAGVNAEIDEFNRAVELERQQAHQRELTRLGNPGNQPRTSGFHDNTGDAPWASFGEFLHAVAAAAAPQGRFPGAGQVDPRLMAASGMSAGVGADGGFLVRTDFSTELLAKAMTESLIWSSARPITIGPDADGVELPFIDETSRANGSRFGGVRMYWKAEAGTVTATAPKLAMHEIRLQELQGLCYATERLLRDARALESIISLAFQSEAAFKLDDAALNGTGGGLPIGILSSGNAALVSVAKEAGQAAATIVKENIDKMWSRMYARSRGRAVWLINQDVEPQLDALSAIVGVGGLPIYLPANGLAGSRLSTLKGAPVIPVEQCATLGTVGDIVLVDLGEYITISKDALEMASSMHVRFIYGEMTYRFTLRANGQPAWRSALTPFSGSANTLSPYVALATRA